jgi:arsenate reductase
MHEVGIDLSRKGTKTVSDLQKTGAAYDTVITVCDAQMPKMSGISGGGRRIAWFFDDPSGFKGSPEEILQRTRGVRDEIEKSILNFIKENK